MDGSCQAEFWWTEKSEQARRNYLKESQLTAAEIELLVILGGCGKVVRRDGNWLVAKVAKREFAGRGFAAETLRKAAVRLSESESALVRIEPGKGGKPSVYWVDCGRLSELSELPRASFAGGKKFPPPELGNSLGNLGNSLPRVKETSALRRASVNREPCARAGASRVPVAEPVAKIDDIDDIDGLGAILRSDRPWSDLRDWHVRTGDLRLARLLYAHSGQTGQLAEQGYAKLFLAQFHHCANLRKAHIRDPNRSDGQGGRHNAAAILASLVRSGRRDVIQNASWEWAESQLRRRQPVED